MFLFEYLQFTINPTFLRSHIQNLPYSSTLSDLSQLEDSVVSISQEEDDATLERGV